MALVNKDFNLYFLYKMKTLQGQKGEMICQAQC
jgi:hypothetical protein